MHPSDPDQHTSPFDQQSESHGLKRELKLADLVLMQVLLILGLSWVGSAGVQGSTHVLLWLAGIAFFYLPLGAAVIHLSRAIPIEGGPYQWVKAGLSPFAGYLAAWNSSAYTIGVFGTIGPSLVNSAAYAAGPKGAWMLTSSRLGMAVGVVCLLAIFAVNVRGLHLGKWITGSGSILTLVLGVFLVYLLTRRWMSGTPMASTPFSLVMPPLSIATLNVFTKMSIGALAGFENTSVFAGECRRPDRDLPRSVLLAAPAIAACYILGTGAMLAYVPPGKIDLGAPLAQLMQAGFGNSGLGQFLATGSILALTINGLAGAVAMVGLSARFPMVIGWDGLLPDWLSELHPRFRTPVKALAVVTGACIAIAVLSSWGAVGYEAVQIGAGAGIACLCIMYALLFSVILFGKSPELRSGIGLRLAALAGFVVSVVSLPFQIVPLTGVADRGIFAIKVGVVVCAINGGGAWLYWQGTRRAGTKISGG
jgi:amino acid transporter